MDDVSAAAKTLADGIVDALPAWVLRSVDRTYRAWAGPPPDAVIAAARQAGQDAAAEIGPAIRALLALDIDEQASTPLAIAREAVRFPTTVLAAAAVPPVIRDAMDQVMFPQDVYGLTPASFGDLDPALVDAGVAWGAGKAWVHRQRHR